MGETRKDDDASLDSYIGQAAVESDVPVIKPAEIDPACGALAGQIFYLIPGIEKVPNTHLVEGADVDRYLTPQLKDTFIRQLITALNGGTFDQRWFDNYMKHFEQRIKEGKVTCSLVNGEPVAIGAFDVVGPYDKNRTLYELGNLVTLPSFQGRGFSSQVLQSCFEKVRQKAPNDPILVTTRESKIAAKAQKMGMKEQSAIIQMQILHLRYKFPGNDEDYEKMIRESVKHMEDDGFRNYIFDPLDKTCQKLIELQRRREAGELEKDNFDFVQWDVAYPDEPLGRDHLGRHALVLGWREFEELGVLTIKLPSGKPFELDYDDVQNTVVFFPEDLG